MGYLWSVILKKDWNEKYIIAMFKLLETDSMNVSPIDFLRDLADKDSVFFIQDGNGNILAYTMLKFLKCDRGDDGVIRIWHGDIILDRKKTESRILKDYTKKVLQIYLSQKHMK